MATHNGTGVDATVQAIFTDDPDFLRDLVGHALQELLEVEMTAHLGATPYERTESRTGQRNGYKPRQLQTRVGTLTLMVPQDRAGTFSTQLFARYQRTEKALVLSLMEMYLEGVSTRKVRDITEALCGTTFSKSLVSRLVGTLDADLAAWPVIGRSHLSLSRRRCALRICSESRRSDEPRRPDRQRGAGGWQTDDPRGGRGGHGERGDLSSSLS